MSGRGKVVCVTGASGYVASWLVKSLLQHAYTVKATVRTVDDPSKTEHLLALDGAAERLHLFEANLLEMGSFDSVVEGCDGVFHTASPVLLSVTDPQAEILDPAVKGTLNVLQSCAKVPSVKRVVITSSMASVMFKRNPVKPDDIIDETWFSDPAFCEESKLFYPLSKTLAEEAALKFAKENKVDLVTLHPGYVVGPFLQPNLNLATQGLLNLINTGRGAFSDGIYRFVDIRDVAFAHIQAFEITPANGRYCLVSKVTHFSEAIKILRKLYPTLNIPETCKDEEPVVPTYQVSRERAAGLGIDFLALEVTLKDTVECLKEKKFLAF